MLFYRVKNYLTSFNQEDKLSLLKMNNLVRINRLKINKGKNLKRVMRISENNLIILRKNMNQFYPNWHS